MKALKRVVATVACVAVSATTVSALAEWRFAGFDLTGAQHNTFYEVYNDFYKGVSTSKQKQEVAPPTWVHEDYELDWPHFGYDVLYLKNPVTGVLEKQNVTRGNGRIPQWDTRMRNYEWEIYYTKKGEKGANYAGHQISQRQQTNIPSHGWRWDFQNPDYPEASASIFMKSNFATDVTTEYKPYSIGILHASGTRHLTLAEAEMYDFFGIAPTVLAPTGIFSTDSLSELDWNGEFVITDEIIKNSISVVRSKYMTGPNFGLNGTDGTKLVSVADSYLDQLNKHYSDPATYEHPNTWNWNPVGDIDPVTGEYVGSFRYTTPDSIGWTERSYEAEVPYNYYQFLVVDGIVMDGRMLSDGTLSPRIFRYNGKATPNVEWGLAFPEAAYPYTLVEQKFLDGKPAIVNGLPVYRAIPSGRHANSYFVITSEKIDYVLEDEFGNKTIIDSTPQFSGKVSHSSLVGPNALIVPVPIQAGQSNTGYSSGSDTNPIPNP